MNSLFFFVWSFLLKFVRSLFRASIVKFIIVSIALAASLYYYVKCNEIPSTEDDVMIEKVAGVEINPAEVVINIHRNYSAAFSKGLVNFVPEYDSLFAGSYNAIQLKSTARRHFLHNPNTFKQSISGWSVDDYIDYARKHIDGGYFLSRDSIDAIYTIWQAFQLKTNNFIFKPEVNVGIKGDNSTVHFFYLASSAVHEHKQNTPFAEVCNVIGFKEKFSDLIYCGCSDMRFNYLSPFDISQMYVKFRLTTPIDSVRLAFNYWGNTDFSKISPEPDIVNFNGIEFYSKNKIEEIKDKGLVFHVRFSDTSNIQSTRMFILATMITILITLWIGMLYEFLPNRLRHFGAQKTYGKISEPKMKNFS